jgi:hypothetical protein
LVGVRVRGPAPVGASLGSLSGSGCAATGSSGRSQSLRFMARIWRWGRASSAKFDGCSCGAAGEPVPRTSRSLRRSGGGFEIRPGPVAVSETLEPLPCANAPKTVRVDAKPKCPPICGQICGKHE